MPYDNEREDDEWVEDDGDPEDDVLQCPSCGGSVHEDTQQCPHCGDWITPVSPQTRVSRWFWTVMVLFLVLGMSLIAVL
jgi:hypothetical protein